MRIKVRMPATPNTIWTKAAARSLIGQRPSLNFRESAGGPMVEEYGKAKIVDAEVFEDGAMVELTIEVGDDERLNARLAGGMRFGTDDEHCTWL